MTIRVITLRVDREEHLTLMRASHRSHISMNLYIANAALAKAEETLSHALSGLHCEKCGVTHCVESDHEFKDGRCIHCGFDEIPHIATRNRTRSNLVLASTADLNDTFAQRNAVTESFRTTLTIEIPVDISYAIVDEEKASRDSPGVPAHLELEGVDLAVERMDQVKHLGSLGDIAQTIVEDNWSQITSEIAEDLEQKDTAARERHQAERSERIKGCDCT